MMHVYIGFDGDDIGKTIESFFIKEYIEKLREFSLKMNETIDNITEMIRKKNGDIILKGGDNIFAKMEKDEKFFKTILNYFKEKTGNDASIGVGNSCLDAYLALKLAKCNKKRLLYFNNYKKPTTRGE